MIPIKFRFSTFTAILAVILASPNIAAAKSDIPSVVASIAAKYGESQPVCSFAVRDLFNHYYNTNELHNMLSNDMVRYWSSGTPNWLSIEMDAAQEIANLGYFVVAGWEDKSGGLGHVSVIVSGEAVEGRWCGVNTLVPISADTGRDRREESIGINWCYGRDKQHEVRFFYYHTPIPKRNKARK
ncbi:MAG: hypothetical protein SNH79_01695 [Rikenellaceae bacterium]